MKFILVFALAFSVVSTVSIPKSQASILDMDASNPDNDPFIDMINGIRDMINDGMGSLRLSRIYGNVMPEDSVSEYYNAKNSSDAANKAINDAASDAQANGASQDQWNAIAGKRLDAGQLEGGVFQMKMRLIQNGLLPLN